MKKIVVLIGLLVAGIIFAESYDYKEPGYSYQKKEPSDSKFLRISALEIKLGKMASRMSELEKRIKNLEAAKL